MTTHLDIPEAIVSQALRTMGVDRPLDADIAGLNALVHAYVRRVPWESASRIVRRAAVIRTENCPRWPAQFWTEAIQYGTGGTCFESNYAFFALLRALGYEGYLTINNMGNTKGCHTALVIRLDDNPYLVDAGYPVFVPVPLDAFKMTQVNAGILTFQARPHGDGTYDIERMPHPKPYSFTLIDNPVTPEDYEAATGADYGADGLFLDTVIINKVIDEHAWRFSSTEVPYHLEHFEGGQRIDSPLEGDIAAQISATFGINAEILRRALDKVVR